MLGSGLLAGALALLTATASAQTAPVAPAAPAAEEWPGTGLPARGNPDPNRPMKVDLGMYTPGIVPGGIGEENRVAEEIYQEWRAKRKGHPITYQQILGAVGGGEGEWLKTQLIGGIAPEILSQNAEVAWQAVGKGWYVPFDKYLEMPNPYVPGNERWIDTFKNPELVRSKVAPDGQLYCIAVDMVETGIFYNKTMLREWGLPEPYPEWTWAEMLALFDQIKARGVTPMITAPMGLGSDWGQDIVMEMLYHDIVPQMDMIPSPPGTVAYQPHFFDPPEAGFLISKGFFTSRDPRWREVNQLIYQWRQYWPRELRNTDMLRQFITQRVPFYWSVCGDVRRFATDPSIDFEWGVTYVPRLTTETSKYATAGTKATLIGGAAMQFHVTNSAVINNNVEDCIDFLMYITAPPQMTRLCNEALQFVPNIKGVQVAPELAVFDEVFSRKPIVMQFMENTDGEPKKYWRRWLDMYINDGIELDPYLKRLDANFQRWIDSHRGSANWDFAPMEQVWQERRAFLEAQLDPPADAESTGK